VPPKSLITFRGGQKHKVRTCAKKPARTRSHGRHVTRATKPPTRLSLFTAQPALRNAVGTCLEGETF
jgi:hypothetical protein